MDCSPGRICPPCQLSVARHFAADGARVVLTPKMTRPARFEYDCVYGSLRGTRYDGKCPDLKIDDYWYEHEGFVTDNPKRAFSNMVNHGLKQSDRIIIALTIPWLMTTDSLQKEE